VEAPFEHERLGPRRRAIAGASDQGAPPGSQPVEPESPRVVRPGFTIPELAGPAGRKDVPSALWIDQRDERIRNRAAFPVDDLAGQDEPLGGRR
jgi:hypothetical protein